MQLEYMTEQEVKRATLRFLKHHYRFRERQGAATLTVDVRGEGGIVADGLYAFTQKNGELFRATFEATATDRQGEVRFRKQPGLMWWDAAALSAITALALLFWAHQAAVLTVAELTLTGSIALLIAVFSAGLAIYRFLIGWHRRYRYIYAIEQFKRYYANEQWIALGEGVFTDFERDPYFLELQNQCRYHGIGLLVLKNRQEPRLLMTPSRTDTFKSKRRNVQLLSQADVNRLFEAGNLPAWLRQFDAENLKRFQQQYKYQALVCLLSALLAAGLLYLQSQKAVTRIVESEEAYQERVALARQRNEQYTQPLEFRIDTPLVWPYPIRSDLQAYLGPQLQPEPARPVAKSQGASPIEAFIASQATVYDCSRIRPLDEVGYIVQEGVYASFTAAMSRVATLESYGFTASAVWLGCFDELENGYALYFGLIFTDLGHARRALEGYERRLGDNVLQLNLNIRSLNPVK